jgi:phage baseplate assembly protein W
MGNTITSNIMPTNKIFSASEAESFSRMIETPLGSRVVRPYFGSLHHELIDKNMDSGWLMLWKKYTFECFLDENNKPWDSRFTPLSVSITSIDSTAGVVVGNIQFEGFEADISTGGFNA